MLTNLYDIPPGPNLATIRPLTNVPPQYALREGGGALETVGGGCTEPSVNFFISALANGILVKTGQD